MKRLTYSLLLIYLLTQQLIAAENGFDNSAQLGDEQVIEKGAPRITDDGVNGIVVDQTITVIGRGFYQVFTNRWRDIKGSTDINITINERPNARTGSLITIKANRNIIYRRFLPPARANIVSAADQAITAAAKNIEKNKIDKLFRNPDLGADEL